MHHRIKRPPGYPFTLAIAVDHLVKKEFDVYREKGELHPVFAKMGLDAKLYNGPDFGVWRNNFKGISYYDEDLQAALYGAVDDVLEFPDGSLAVVDYKSTGAKQATVYDDYQKQMDTYAHILARMGHKVHGQAYFLFYVVDKTGESFNNILPFNEEVKSVNVDSSWVGPAFEKAIKLARQDKAPAPGPECNHCKFVGLAGTFDGLSVNQHGGFEKHDANADKDYVIVEE